LQPDFVAQAVSGQITRRIVMYLMLPILFKYSNHAR
jgi:hypothetical protein